MWKQRRAKRLNNLLKLLSEMERKTMPDSYFFALIMSHFLFPLKHLFVNTISSIFKMFCLISHSLLIFQFPTGFSVSLFWETGKKQHWTIWWKKKKKEPESAVVSSKPDNFVIKALEVNWLSAQGKRIVHEHKLKYLYSQILHYCMSLLTS